MKRISDDLPRLCMRTGARGFEWIRHHRRSAGFALAAVAVALIYPRLAWSDWIWLGWLCTQTLQHLLHLLLGNQVTSYMGREGFVMVKYRGYVSQLAPGCWGMDGLFLFTLVLLILSTFFRQLHARWRDWLSCFALGLSMMFVLNILRITTLVVLGGYLRCQSLRLTNVLQPLIHRQFGWCLYTLGICFFFSLWLSPSATSKRVPVRSELV